MKFPNLILNATRALRSITAEVSDFARNETG